VACTGCYFIVAVGQRVKHDGAQVGVSLLWRAQCACVCEHDGAMRRFVSSEIATRVKIRKGSECLCVRV
jgi:hypothetical protein